MKDDDGDTYDIDESQLSSDTSAQDTLFREIPLTPHKHHADIRLAWALGAKVEYKTDNTIDWRPCVHTPSFTSSMQYRIKPEETKKQKEIREIREQMETLATRLKELEGN